MKICEFGSVFLLLLLTEYTEGLNILGIFPYHGKSHSLVFRIFLRELARRGHNTTIISHYPEEDPPQNYHDISLAGTIKPIEDEAPLHTSKSLIYVSINLANKGTTNCRTLLGNKQVQQLLEEKPKFDVIIVEQYNTDCGLGVAYKLQAPVITIMSHILMPYHYARLGIPYNPAYVPFHFLEGGTKPTLYQRVERIVYDAIFRSIYYFMCQRVDQNTLAQYFDDIPPLEDLARHVKFLLIYQHFILAGSRLFPPNVIEVGGYHVAESKPLTGDLRKFMDEAEHGVIYISFGSVVKASTMPLEKMQAVLEVIRELPQRFVWKWEDQTLMGDKSKLYTAKWLPQVDILGHPKLVAFWTHAGNGGTTEAIHFGVPMVASPVLGDQPANAAAIQESGVGVFLPMRELTKDSLMKAFQKVLDTEFQRNVKSISKAWHDRPMSPLDTAVYWTEYAARHSNFTFRTAAADVPYYQYIHLDIIAVFLTFFVSLVILLRFIFLVYSRLKDRSQSLSQKKII